MTFMHLPVGFTIRRASLDDLSTLVSHRELMFRDMGYKDEVALQSMSARFRAWLPERIDSGRYLAWLALSAEGAVAAGAGLWLMDWIPHMIGQGTERGNILNVYTDPAYRRRGLARVLMETAITWCRGNRIDTIILHASPAGRSLYESMGFSTSNEMRMRL